MSHAIDRASLHYGATFDARDLARLRDGIVGGVAWVECMDRASRPSRHGPSCDYAAFYEGRWYALAADPRGGYVYTFLARRVLSQPRGVAARAAIRARLAARSSA